MLVVTTEHLHGYEIREVLGEVIGVTARTNNPFNEGIRSLHGGTNPKMMENLIRWREEAVERMAQEALKRGANAVVGMRFDHRDLTASWMEICAYGTAAVVALLPSRERVGPGRAAPRRHPAETREHASMPRSERSSGRAAAPSAGVLAGTPRGLATEAPGSPAIANPGAPPAGDADGPATPGGPGAPATPGDPGAQPGITHPEQAAPAAPGTTSNETASEGAPDDAPPRHSAE